MSEHGRGKSSIRAVIWDLDGVIVDSAEQHLQAWQRLVQESNVRFTDDDFWATFGQCTDDVVRKFWSGRSPQEIAELGRRKESYYRELLAGAITALPGAVERIAEFQAAGLLQAVASSAPQQNVELIINTLQLRSYFAALVSGEGVPRGKPAPDIFVHAAAQLHVVPARCVVIEDARVGVQAAGAAGMACIGVTNSGDGSAVTEADMIIETLNQLSLALLQSIIPSRGAILT